MTDKTQTKEQEIILTHLGRPFTTEFFDALSRRLSRDVSKVSKTKNLIEFLDLFDNYILPYWSDVWMPDCGHCESMVLSLRGQIAKLAKESPAKLPPTLPTNWDEFKYWSAIVRKSLHKPMPMALTQMIYIFCKQDRNISFQRCLEQVETALGRKVTSKAYISKVFYGKKATAFRSEKT